MATVNKGRGLLAALALASVFAGACRSAATPPVVRPAATAAAAAAVPDSIRWVETSAEFRAAFEQTYRLATAHVEAESAKHAAGAWAVILDADETILSNATYQRERALAGLPFTQESWTAWVRRREATPLPGAAAFLARVHALGGRIAIVTNRLQSECADTESVLQRYQLIYDAILCRADQGPSDKNPRFAAVASGESAAGSGTLAVVAFVGDNILDFPGMSQAIKDQGAEGLRDFGARYFMLPNPMYGSWQ